MTERLLKQNRLLPVHKPLAWSGQVLPWTQGLSTGAANQVQQEQASEPLAAVVALVALAAASAVSEAAQVWVVLALSDCPLVKMSSLAGAARCFA